jgi:exopolyphosphatase/guanosine-5'-triphosphate,3'-diphosphate pyrophosphatase
MVPARAVRKLAAKLAKMSLPEREAVPGIGPRRAEIIVAGAEVYAEIFESFGLKGFRYSPLGLRDGILAQMLAEQDARAKAHREFEHERRESVLATARRYGVDPRQAEPVRAHTVQLFRELKSMHELSPNTKAGWPLPPCSATPANSSTTRAITGTRSTSSPALRFTATRNCSARWSRPSRAILGKSRPQPGDRALRNIPADEHKNVNRAVVLLRLAVALNQDRASDVLRVSTRVYPKRVYLELRRGAPARNWSCGRCARKPATSARSSGASSLSRWHR